MRTKNSKDIWVSPRKDGRWEVKRAGAKRASLVCDTQREADRHARRFAKITKGERVTQSRKGRIRSKDSYGNDPRRSKDTEH